jgi:cytochrome c553
MAPMAAPLSDQDIDDLGAYFSRSPFTAPARPIPRSSSSDSASTVPATSIRRSRRAPGCHGPDGRGNEPAGYASIQDSMRLMSPRSLRAYRAGERKTDPNEMMRNVAALLSDEEIDAVASYVQGLR